MATYCISDLHGHFKNFENFLNILDEKDTVYVLGDVIDKGKEPIKLLLTIKNDSRFKMLLGNHEYMMFQYLTAKEGSYVQRLAYHNWIGRNDGAYTLKGILNN